MDRDGDLDLLIANFGAEPLLLRNDSPERHWITVALEDPSTPGNEQGLGAKVVGPTHRRRPGHAVDPQPGVL